jgi:hypothetical protein
MSDIATFALLILCAFMFLFALMIFASRQDEPRKEAEQKARKVLIEWLSPAQLAQYKRTGHFEVTGCHSGKRYRIRSDRQLNIDELDERDRTVAIWCFGPKGHLPIGDIMLAQKIALETNEYASLEFANGNPARRRQCHDAEEDQQPTTAFEIRIGRHAVR